MSFDAARTTAENLNNAAIHYVDAYRKAHRGDTRATVTERDACDAAERVLQLAALAYAKAHPGEAL